MANFFNSDSVARHLNSARRSLLRSVPVAAGMAVLQGCGGGGAAVAATPPVGTGSSVPGLAASTAWASRPAAAGATGQSIMVTDVGVNGSVWLSTGVTWVSLASPLTLCHRFSDAQMDGTVGANTDVFLDAFTIPAYVLGPTSSLRIQAAYSFPGAGLGNKAPQIKAYFGLATYAAGFYSLLDTRGQFSTQKSFLLDVLVQNKNALAANRIRPNDYGSGASNNAFADAAIDFSQAVSIGLGALNNSASASPDDQQRLEWFSVELVA